MVPRLGAITVRCGRWTIGLIGRRVRSGRRASECPTRFPVSWERALLVPCCSYLAARSGSGPPTGRASRGLVGEHGGLDERNIVEVLDCPREVVEEVITPDRSGGPGDRARLGGYRLVRVGPERAG